MKSLETVIPRRVAQQEKIPQPSTQSIEDIIPQGSDSGSILKLLSENGFKDKMEAGLAKGSTYKIIHSPGSESFTLVEKTQGVDKIDSKYHNFTISQPKPEVNTYEQHKEDTAKLGEVLEQNAQALSQENLQKMYGAEKDEVAPEKQVDEINGYEQYKQDNEKLAEMVGEQAAALDPENLKKIYTDGLTPGQAEPKIDSEPSGAIDQSNIVADNLPGDFGGIQTPSLEENHAETEEKSSTPEVVSQKTENQEDIQARAQSVAEKIKNGGALMTAEDWEFRNKNWSEIEKHLIQAANPEVPEIPDQGEAMKSFIEREYGVDVDNPEKELEKISTTPEAATPEVTTTPEASGEPEKEKTLETKEAEKDVEQLINVINNEKARKRKEAKEMGQYETEPVRRRQEKAFEKLVNGLNTPFQTLMLGLFTILFGTILAATGIVGLGIQAGSNTYDLLKERFSKFKDKKSEEKKPTSPEKPKDTEVKTEDVGDELEEEDDKEKEVQIKTPAQRKNEYLEKIYGGKLEGYRKEEWDDLKEIDAEGFIYPEDEKIVDWGLDEKGDKRKVTVDDYPEEAKKLHEKVSELWKKEQAAGKTMKKGIKLDEYIDYAITNNLI